MGISHSGMGQAASECILVVCTAVARLIQQQPKLKVPVASVVVVVVGATVTVTAGAAGGSCCLRPCSSTCLFLTVRPSYVPET